MNDFMDEFVNNTDFSQNKPLREMVYESLRDTIIAGKIPLGQRIVEKEYAERLNISRTPVREALKQLEAEELVEYIPRMGAVVKLITKNDVIEIYKIRHSLELLATTTAMEHITAEEIEEIETLLDLTEQKNKEGCVDYTTELFETFNTKIYAASKMNRLPFMISKLNKYIERFRKISISDKTRRKNAIDEHRKILKCIIDKDREGIDLLIQKHLDDSLEIVLKEIEE